MTRSATYQIGALCILDALLKGFGEGGYSIQLADHRSACVHIHGENVTIQIWEQTSSKWRNLSPQELARCIKLSRIDDLTSSAKAFNYALQL